ncbi:MAG TPA: FAD-binding protein [Bacteroidetes bacterium]|nr:FAD-binding protein [Bacteroidota bacterium]
MPSEIEIRVKPQHVDNEARHRKLVAGKLGISPSRITAMKLRRRSVDARPRPAVFQLRYVVWVDEEPELEAEWDFPMSDVAQAPPVIIIGFGPAGMFAALRLIELGLRPIVLERGKAVRARRRDLALLNKEGQVNPESNYCFGEGGAGTFSDGKLYTRAKKRGDVRRILEIFVKHGAVRDILIDAHPHIGTNKLPQIIESVRETILAHGGEIHFEKKVDDFLRDAKGITGVCCADGTTVKARSVILATGHSARDIFQLLQRQKLTLEAKPFALGVRVEHPQAHIDELRYRMRQRPETLPAASYALVDQVLGRGVYSFCMCPGGIICPAATADDELVVNGWSPSKRNSPFANAGIVVEVKPEDLANFEQAGALAGLGFQASVEKAAFEAGGGKQVAPAQRLTDFVAGKISADLPENSYLPGMRATDLSAILPKAILERLVAGFQLFEQKMRGYISREALVVATESRTSSPVRIPRDRENLMHPELEGFFPCGEGAGYAGGIMSAAMDGERCAEAAQRFYKQEASPLL